MKFLDRVQCLYDRCIPEKYNIRDCDELQPNELKPILLPYQRRAVSWMLDREGLYYDESSKTFVSRKNQNEQAVEDTFSEELRKIQGGILADEMVVVFFFIYILYITVITII